MTIPKYIVPNDVSKDEWVSHKNRYEFACKRIGGKMVLDAACGTGYGSQMMLDAGAKKVVGIDLDEDALSYAISNYGAEFKLMDMTETGFGDNTFEVIVCFAAIGAAPDTQKFFDEIKRILRPKGTFIVSAAVLGKSTMENRRLLRLSHHYTKDELLSMFKRNFIKVEFYAQGEQFYAFPGRGVVNKILGIVRDHTIVPLEDKTNPRIVLCVGKPRKS